MSTKYKATELDSTYFVTITTVGWIDVFTKLIQKQVLINALKYCQKNKGLEIYADCLMSNQTCPERSRRVHILCKAPENENLSDILRDFKKYTSKKIIETIINFPESRREWMLAAFEKACSHLSLRFGKTDII